MQIPRVSHGNLWCTDAHSQNIFTNWKHGKRVGCLYKFTFGGDPRDMQNAVTSKPVLQPLSATLFTHLTRQLHPDMGICLVLSESIFNRLFITFQISNQIESNPLDLYAENCSECDLFKMQCKFAPLIEWELLTTATVPWIFTSRSTQHGFVFQKWKMRFGSVRNHLI